MKVKIKEFKLSERKCYVGKMSRHIGETGVVNSIPIYYSPTDDFAITRVDFEDGHSYWFEGKDLEQMEEE